MTRGAIGWTAGLALLGLAGACGGGGSHPETDAPPGGHDLTVTLFKHAPFVDGDNDVAAALAVQDGDGDWTSIAPAPAAAGGVYRAHLMSDRYGVAIGCRDGNSLSVAVFQRAASDGLDLRTRSCGLAKVELDVDVSDVPAGGFAYVSAAGQAASGGGDATYSFQAQPGSADLFASLSDATGRMTRLVRVPTFDLEAAQHIAIDFATQGAAPEDRELTVALAAGDLPQVTTSVVRPTGEYLMSAGSAIGAPASYQMLPTALQQPDDLFEITVTAGTRSTSITRKAPGSLAFQLPTELIAPAPTLVLAPQPRPIFAFDVTTAELALQTYQLHARTARAPDDVYRDWTVELSAAWFTFTTSVKYGFPDLSVLPDFAEFRLFEAVPIRWAVRRTDTSTPGAADGRITRSAAQSGTIDGYCGDGILQPPETCDPPDGTTCSASCTKL